MDTQSSQLEGPRASRAVATWAPQRQGGRAELGSAAAIPLRPPARQRKPVSFQDVSVNLNTHISQRLAEQDRFRSKIRRSSGGACPRGTWSGIWTIIRCLPWMQEFAADYESVRKVLKAGEAFCHASELSFSRDAQALCDKVNALRAAGRNSLRICLIAELSKGAFASF